MTEGLANREQHISRRGHVSLTTLALKVPVDKKKALVPSAGASAQTGAWGPSGGDSFGSLLCF